MHQEEYKDRINLIDARRNVNMDISVVAEKVINKLISSDDTSGLNDHLGIYKWEWPQGVALYSLFKYYQNTGNKEYLNFINDWFEKMLQGEEVPKNVNTMAPLISLACITEINPNKKYIEFCKQWAEWVMNEMPRTQEGGLQHITSDTINKEQIWDDTLFMTVLFIAKMGKILDRQDMMDEAVSQFLLHIKYLYDKETGLWFHGWTFDGRNNFGEALWARGNSWYTSAVVELIEILDLKGPVKKYLVDTLEAQVSKLSELQDESGLWHTLLDDKTSYTETSASAGFAYGILKAVRLNLIDKKYKVVGLKAANAVIEEIGEDGSVYKVSYGTAMGMDKDHYRNIEICCTAYGQGLTFLMLTEMQRI